MAKANFSRHLFAAKEQKDYRRQDHDTVSLVERRTPYICHGRPNRNAAFFVLRKARLVNLKDSHVLVHRSLSFFMIMYYPVFGIFFMVR